MTFRLASGNVGVMAATNEVVAAADPWVNLALFTSVSLLCLVTFRSLPVTACIILPLALVTVLCNAADGVIGNRREGQHAAGRCARRGRRRRLRHLSFDTMKHEMEDRGLTLHQAFVEALKQRGTASVFTAVTMTVPSRRGRSRR